MLPWLWITVLNTWSQFQIWYNHKHLVTSPLGPFYTNLPVLAYVSTWISSNKGRCICLNFKDIKVKWQRTAYIKVAQMKFYYLSTLLRLKIKGVFVSVCELLWFLNRKAHLKRQKAEDGNGCGWKSMKTPFKQECKSTKEKPRERLWLCLRVCVWAYFDSTVTLTWISISLQGWINGCMNKWMDACVTYFFKNTTWEKEHKIKRHRQWDKDITASDRRQGSNSLHLYILISLWHFVCWLTLIPSNISLFYFAFKYFPLAKSVLILLIIMVILLFLLTFVLN